MHHPRCAIAHRGMTTTRLGLLHKRSKGRGVVRMPARQGRAIFDDVARCPEDPPLVKTSGHVVIGAQNVKVAGVQPLDHEVDGLLRRPGPGRLLGAALGGKPGEYKTRNHQVRADPAAGRVSQLVLQRLGEGFDACLGNIIRGVARWRRDALLRAGIDDEAWAPTLDHAGCKDLRPVNHAPEVHADNAPPVLQRPEHLAARLDAGIVHQDVGAAEDNLVAASARRLESRSAIHTFIPKRANRIAAARPSPDAPPVTTATLLADMAAWGT